ncbi:MAG: hypothetical protein PHW60_11765 [Kiritimatiellae bacterium]|nr:hypothetical protein [Kiritimatiellia bacterium]
MCSWKSIVFTCLLSLAIWLAFSWPVPRLLTNGIASSGRNIEAFQRRAMIPGDHLQFIYHFWLFSDTLAGHTPWFHNLYEFNTGDDSERRAVTTYYLPFALVFALCAQIGSLALAWNLTGFIAIWITFLATFLLARRYADDCGIPWIAALLAVAFPYHWYALLGGSPTGLGMMWVPIILLGLDLMVAESRVWGGTLAGAAILLAGWVDSHIFFFAALIAPAWCLFAYWYHRNRLIPTWREFKRLCIAVLPLLGFLVLILFQAYFMQRGLADTALARQGRNASEVWLSSPKLSGAVTRDIANPACVIYAGWSLLGLLGAGLLAFLARCTRREVFANRRAWGLVLLLLGITVIIFLAAGMNNPGGPRAWHRLTHLLSPYAMIRNPTKIYCLLPAVAAVAATLALNHLFAFLPRRGMRRVILGLLALLLLVDFKGMVQPTICLLDRRQAAYEAIARDARDHGRRAHLLALPLWPGDSHFTSVNQYYAALYRLRMVNGYRPTVRKKYSDDIFLRFQSFNRGAISDAQLDNLQARGIAYIVLHEDLFPEKVSPFPVGATLQALQAHPRLAFLQHAETVWSFRILRSGETKPPASVPVISCPVYFPARRWELERYGNPALAVVPDPECSGKGFLRLAPGATNPAALSVTTAFIEARSLPGLRWMLRARGNTTITLHTRPNEQPSGDHDGIPAELTNAWKWYSAPIDPVLAESPLALMVVADADGMTDLDSALLTAGDWSDLLPGATRNLPATCFFHAGYSDPERNAVILRRDRDPAAAVFYGPKLPLASGAYEVELCFTSAAARGTLLGFCNLRMNDRDERNQVQVIAGQRACIAHNQPDNRSVNLVFVYTRNADVEIEGVAITRRK